MRKRKHSALTQSRLRSAITNGNHLFLKNIDGRTRWMRRIKDLLHGYEESDCGGSDTLSEGQRAIIRRAVMLQVQCEFLEHKFAQNDGIATRPDLETYQRASNSLRRLIESLQLHTGRKAREVNPHDDVGWKAYQAEMARP
jgi:hypothetical protein